MYIYIYIYIYIFVVLSAFKNNLVLTCHSLCYYASKNNSVVGKHYRVKHICCKL